jgi:iron-chelate-transporting ATPase
VPATCLTADRVVLAYERTEVVHGVSVRLDPGVVTALVGPNGSGKSTLLRSLARLHRIGAGRVELAADGVTQDVSALAAREFATKVTLLSQSRPHPSGLAVRDVVAFGRHPHRRRFAALTDADRAAVDRRCG